MTQTRFRQRPPDSMHSKTVMPPPAPASSLESSLLSSSLRPPGRTYHVAKRLLDIGFATAGMVVFAPVLAAVAVAVKIDSPGPALIRQTRVGLNGRTFTCYKFRSMRTDAEQIQENLVHLNERNGPIFKIKDDPRRTRLGKFIRKFSLDEMPQLLNILKGEMTVVGPRPPLPKEVADYQPHHLRRLEVVPGLTGLQQITARDESDFERWVRLDVEYIESRNLWLDLWIIFRTVPAAVSGKGAS